MSFSPDTTELEFETKIEYQGDFEVAPQDFEIDDGAFLTFLYYLGRENPDSYELFIQIWADKVKPYYEWLVADPGFDADEFEDLLRTFSTEYFQNDDALIFAKRLESDKNTPVTIFLGKLHDYLKSFNRNYYQISAVFMDEYSKLKETYIHEIDHDEAYAMFKNVLLKKFASKESRSEASINRPKLTRNREVSNEEMLSGEKVATLGDLTLFDNNVATFREKVVLFTPTTFRFLLMLIQYPDTIIRTGVIIEFVLQRSLDKGDKKKMAFIHEWKNTLYSELDELGINREIISHVSNTGYQLLSPHLFSPDDNGNLNHIEKNITSKYHLHAVEKQGIIYFIFGEISLHKSKNAKWRVEVANKEGTISATEATVLIYFLKHPDVRLSGDRLLKDCWNDPPGTENSKVVTMVGKLKRNLIALGCSKDIIRSTFDGGYQFISDQVK